MTSMDRRQFIKKAGTLASVLPLTNNLYSHHLFKTDEPKISVFSKHLQFLEYDQMAKAAAQIGFDGVELTVRPNGHVFPDRVTEDLPKAVAAIKSAGFKPSMIVTAVNDPTNPTDQQVLQTASQLGVKYYRMGYFRYTKGGEIPKDHLAFKQHINGLAEMNNSLGLIGCYQNHAGNYVGASMFELYQLFNESNSRTAGLQYDIRHATVEGGKSWETGLRLVKDKIKTLALKDFRWEKKNGKWDTVNTPMGEGMVDFNRFFSLMKQYGIQVPMSIHFEYPMGGAEHGDREITIKPDKVFEYMHHDLEYIRRAWREA